MAAAPHTLAERILAHLAAHPIEEDAADVPRQVTQEGISDALGARVAHVSRALKHLITEQKVSARLAHPEGGKRRARAHFLTEEGRVLARALPPTARERVAGHAAADDTAPLPSVPAGRHAEFERLQAALAEAEKDGPRCILVEGDAGAGKTRLLAAFAARAAKEALVVSGQSTPTGDEQLLGPLTSALAPLGFDRRFRARNAGTPRERALGAAIDSLVASAREEPVIVILDDLHYAGASVAEFIHGLLRGLPGGTRVLLVASFRREEAWSLPNGPLYAALDPLRNATRTTLVDLRPLTREGVAALLEDAGVHVLGEKKLPADLVDRVWKESGGNAFYALAMGEELADGVDESDFFPEPVRAAAKQHFSGLPPGALDVLQLAAVAGNEVDYALLKRGYDGTEDALVATLDQLIDRLLLEEVPRAEDLRLRFRHPKVRDAILNDATATRRRWLESRVAEARRV